MCFECVPWRLVDRSSICLGGLADQAGVCAYFVCFHMCVYVFLFVCANAKQSAKKEIEEYLRIVTAINAIDESLKEVEAQRRMLEDDMRALSEANPRPAKRRGALQAEPLAGENFVSLCHV